VIPVDLFGQSADQRCDRRDRAAEGLFVLDDRRAGFGASYKGRRLGYVRSGDRDQLLPAKPFFLGCFGDGGAISPTTTRSPTTLRSIRVHGQGSDKYDNVGLASTAGSIPCRRRLLIENLKIFEDEIAARNAVRSTMQGASAMSVTVPRLAAGCTSVWAQYTSAAQGSTVTASPPRFKRRGFRPRSTTPSPCTSRPPTGIFRSPDGGLPACERLSDDVISLPMHAYLDEPTQERVIKPVRDALQA